MTEVPTIDQHPFFYFLLQGRAAAHSGQQRVCAALRIGYGRHAACAGCLCDGALLCAQERTAGLAPLWSALLAATSPFFLWYGQEARPYALWAVLAVLSTYLLLRSIESEPSRRSLRRWHFGYGVALLVFLTTHYYAVFLLPVHIHDLQCTACAQPQARACCWRQDCWRLAHSLAQLRSGLCSPGGRRQLQHCAIPRASPRSAQRLQPWSQC